MTILLDPGHGSDTPGKRSPDGRFREYAFNRDIAARVASKLTSLGLNAEIIVPELTDVPLKERVSRINAHCTALGTGNAICISIHANAAGNGSKWMNARGWRVVFQLVCLEPRNKASNFQDFDKYNVFFECGHLQVRIFCLCRFHFG